MDTKTLVKILTWGDPHFKKNNVRDSEDFVKASLKVAQSIQPDIFMILGDVLDSHESSNQKPYSQATDWILALSKIAPTYVLIGNHDRPNNNIYLTDEHFFNPLKEWDNTYIIDQPTKIKVKGLEFVLVPYVPNGRFHDALKLVDGWKSAQCIFAHQEFKGVKMGFVTSIHGDVWSTDLPLMVTGHIHEYSKPQSNIIYVGTPRQNAFDESPDKAITLFTFGQKTVEERIDLGLRKKRQITIMVDELEDSKMLVPENCDLKITVVGRISEIKTVKKLSLIKTWLKQGYKVTYKDIPDIVDEKSQSSQSSQLSFANLFYTKCSLDKELKAEFENIFGTVETKAKEEPKNGTITKQRAKVRLV